MVKTEKVIAKTVLLVLGVLLIDTFIHTFFTVPFETWFYFVVKIIIVACIGYVLFSDFSNLGVAIATATFVLIFAVYYRLLEFAFGLQFGARVPDILSISYASNPGLSTLVWAIAHGTAFAVPALLIGRYAK